LCFVVFCFVVLCCVVVVLLLSFIDIQGDKIEKKYYNKDHDTELWHSEKTNRGPLKNGWRDDSVCSKYTHQSIALELTILMCTASEPPDHVCL